MFVQVTAKNVGGVFFETQCSGHISTGEDVTKNVYYLLKHM